MAAFIASQRDAHGVPQAVSCRALGVSQSWFYKWKDGQLPPRAARRERLKAEIARPGKGRWRAPDLVKRKFAAGGINRRWYGDGTEIVTGEGKLYLDSVMDMGSRRILGHALGAHHDAALAYGRWRWRWPSGRCRARRGVPHRSGQRGRIQPAVATLLF